MTSLHLLVAISSHGYGHLAQTAPVVNAMRKRLPELRVTVRTGIPRPLLDARIEGDFALQAEADDFGMRQLSAFDVDVEASAAAYRLWHDGWQRRVDGVAAQLRGSAPDLVFADVPYLTLAAAQRTGVPAVALCSLNWLEIYRHYCGKRPEATPILDAMTSAYGSARFFLRPTPSMPMEGVTHAREIGPIAQQGSDRRAELNERMGWDRNDRLILVALGGIATRLPAERWPRLPGVRWIFQRDWNVNRDDALVLEEMGMDFSDLLASCDLLFTKPGYGSFTEAAAAGTPVLYVERNDWPESAALCAWLHDRGHVRAITPEQAASGRFTTALAALLAQGRRDPVAMSGIDEAAQLLERMLLRQ